MITICGLMGHKWRYNFASLPNKRICERCRKRQQWSGFIRDKWLDGFIEQESRTDEELIAKWIKP